MEIGFKIAVIFWMCWFMTIIVSTVLFKDENFLPVLVLGAIFYLILFILGEQLDKKKRKEEWAKITKKKK